MEHLGAKDGLITYKMLKTVCPKTNVSNEFLFYLNKYITEFQVNTSLRIAHFLSQVSHESSCFTKTKESLYYTEKRFLTLDKNTKTPNGVDFNNRETYKHLIKNDTAVANWRYGDTNNKGIQVNYRERGFLHTTWKANYKLYADFYQKNIIVLSILLSILIY